MNNNSRPRSLSVGGGERNRQHVPNAVPPEMIPPMLPFPEPSSFPLINPSHFAGLYPDPLDDVLRSLTTYTTDPLAPQQLPYTQPQQDESYLSNMAPHQQFDPATLAWLQLLQSQMPPQHDLGVGGSTKAQGDVQQQSGREPTQPPHTPDDGTNLEEENDSEEERATTEDKRRRNTAASARFRNKKKQWLLSMERTVTSLSRQVDELEREAADLRRENGWLKEIVMLKARRATGGGLLNFPGTLGERNDGGQPDAGKGKQRQQ